MYSLLTGRRRAVSQSREVAPIQKGADAAYTAELTAYAGNPSPRRELLKGRSMLQLIWFDFRLSRWPPAFARALRQLGHLQRQAGGKPHPP